MTEQPLPILMLPGEIIGMKEACDLSRRDRRTVAKICAEHFIGYQITKNSPWEISSPALIMAMTGDFAALEQLRAGNRNHPRVRHVLAFLGIREP